MIEAGIEPAIFGFVDQRVIHCATRPMKVNHGVFITEFMRRRQQNGRLSLFSILINFHPFLQIASRSPGQCLHWLGKRFASCQLGHL